MERAAVDAAVERKEEESMEAEFEKTRVPTWKEQITFRAMLTSFVLNVIFNFIVCKLNLTTGVIPSLNVAAGLLGFAILKSYEVVLQKLGLLRQPFTRQENTVVQTCVVACAGIAFSSGTASYIVGMTPLVASQADAGNTPLNVKKLSLGWMICFNLLVSFVGLFSITFLRKTMILGYKLTYPSGTATATLINSFHTSKGGKLAKKQVMKLFNYSIFSFCWAFFQWFFTAGDGCGFANFPTFGLQAYARNFYFDFSATYVGVGMICPYMVNVSLLFGAVVSWFIMWPIIESKKGIWYSADLPGNSLHGLQGYKVLIAVAVMLGDGLFHVVYMLVKTIISLKQRRSKHRTTSSTYASVTSVDVDEPSTTTTKKPISYDEQKRNEHFMQDQIPLWAALAGYIGCAVLSIICVPLIFPQLKFYHLIAVYIFAPIFAFCNAYGCGLSDWSLASNYGKIAIFIFSAWVGIDNGGIIAGLASCGVMMNIVSTASDLMQDFKTGYLTLSSPRSMLLAQIAGTLMGCLISPPVFWLFYRAYSVGDPNGSYPAPYGLMYRGIALLGSEGVASLPEHCLELTVGFFVAAAAVCGLREVMKSRGCRWYKVVPSPMCMAIPFYLGGYFAIDMVVGSAVVWVWERRNKKSADSYRAAVASGLICGDSLWGIPAAILALAGANPPICMRFFTSSVNQKVSAFLGS